MRRRVSVYQDRGINGKLWRKYSINFIQTVDECTRLAFIAKFRTASDMVLEYIINGRNYSTIVRVVKL
jgi:hypothetical protein